MPICVRRLEYVAIRLRTGGLPMTGGIGRGMKIKLIVVLGLVALGFCFGLNLSEEKKHRVKKLFSEAREMPFRLFV